MRYIARAIEERGTAAVIVLTKWDAVPNKVSWPSDRNSELQKAFGCFCWNLKCVFDNTNKGAP